MVEIKGLKYNFSDYEQMWHSRGRTKSEFLIESRLKTTFKPWLYQLNSFQPDHLKCVVSRFSS